mmetsp:Transcript_18485/g.37773  ORF Transcript_18485/g.37773 Transcript_18485/m.37773 type:complete len:207 (+) Transcript_18485:420-1040(+)
MVRGHACAGRWQGGQAVSRVRHPLPASNLHADPEDLRSPPPHRRRHLCRHHAPPPRPDLQAHHRPARPNVLSLVRSALPPLLLRLLHLLQIPHPPSPHRRPSFPAPLHLLHRSVQDLPGGAGAGHQRHGHADEGPEERRIPVQQRHGAFQEASEAQRLQGPPGCRAGPRSVDRPPPHPEAGCRRPGLHQHRSVHGIPHVEAEGPRR